MKLSVPVYVVALVAAFLYGLLLNIFPDLPLTQEQIQWIIVAILTALNVDVVQALRARGVAGIR